MEDLAQLFSDLERSANQALQYATELLDDLRQAQIYLAQVGDLWTFIQNTVQMAVAELPRLHAAFTRAL